MSERSQVTPDTPTERRLIEIWKELLRVKRVGLHDDFFELGGDSISVMRLANRLVEEFEYDGAYETLLDRALTIADLAAQLDADERARRDRLDAQNSHTDAARAEDA